MGDDLYYAHNGYRLLPPLAVPEPCAAASKDAPDCETAKAALVPPRVDLRARMMPVRDQQQEGSCVAFTTSAMREYYARAQAGFTDYLSSQYIYDRRANPSGAGMAPADAFDILRRFGVCPEAEYADVPYEHTPPEAQTLAAHDTAAAVFRIQSAAQLRTAVDARAALAAQGPLGIMVNVYPRCDAIIWKPAAPGDAPVGAHMMCVVGYDDQVDGGVFMVRNSWGAQWGDGTGHVQLPYTEWDVFVRQCWSMSVPSPAPPLPAPPAPPSPFPGPAPMPFPTPMPAPPFPIPLPMPPMPWPFPTPLMNAGLSQKLVRGV